MKFSKKDILTIPNFLSFFRLILIPFFIVLYLKEYYRLSSIILIVSGITDFADGFIARKFGQISELGKVLDPIADKLTQAAIVFCMVFRHFQVLFLLILLVVKELYMGINDLILLKKGKKLGGAKWFGKVSTAVFYICMSALLMFPDFDAKTVNTLLIITSFFLALSFLMYIPVFTKMHKEAAKDK